MQPVRLKAQGATPKHCPLVITLLSVGCRSAIQIPPCVFTGLEEGRKEVSGWCLVGAKFLAVGVGVYTQARVGGEMRHVVLG